MTPVELVTVLHTAGCRLIPEGEHLRVQDPQQALTADVRQAIRQHKAALLSMLTPERRIALPRYPAPCWRCKGPSERQGLRYLLCATCLAQERQGEPHHDS